MTSRSTLSFRNRCRTPRVAFLLLLVPTILGIMVSSVPGSGAQEPDPAAAVLTIESVSPWVQPEGVFQVAFSPTSPIASGTTLTYTIGQRLRPEGSQTLRELTDEVLSQGERVRSLQAPQTVDAAELGDPAAPVLEIPIRSGSGDAQRQLVPTSGIHPVRLDLADPAGNLLWRNTVYLNRLPETTPLGRDGAPASTAVQLLASLDSGPTLSVNGEVELPTEERAILSSVQSLLTETADLPLTVALRPNTLMGLQRSTEEADRAFVEQIPRSRWSLAQQSYTRVNAASLASGGSTEFARQIEVGSAILTAMAGRDQARLWMLDDTVAPPSAKVLRLFGTSHLFVSAGRVAVEGGIDESVLRSRSVALENVDGLSVSTYDAELTRLLVEPGLEPALAAHRTITLMMGEWFDALAGGGEPFPGVTSAIVLPPGVQPEALRDLAAPLSGDGPLRIAPPPPAASGDPAPSAVLRALDAPDMDSVVDRTNAVGSRIEGYRSMIGADDPLAAQWDLVNDQAPSQFAEVAEREGIWSDINSAIDAQLGRLVTPPNRTVVLTSGSGSIPLRFQNGLDTEVRLLMRTRSPRLDFPEGAVREIVLAPGENRIDVAVEVQASGSSLMRIELTSPDGSIVFPESTVTVRSSSISGVGAALSVISVLVLAAWWIRTHRRRSDNGQSGTPNDYQPGAGPDSTRDTVSPGGSGDEGTSA